MTHEGKRRNILFFLLGLGTFTKVFLLGCIAITELACFVLAPYLFIKKYKALRRDGFLPFLMLVLLSMVGGVVATCAAGNGMFMLMNHMARLYSIFSVVVVFYCFLSENQNGLRWFFVGACISSVLSIFVLNPEAHVSEAGLWVEQMRAEEVFEGVMFWMQRLRSLMDVFISGFYFETPMPVLLSLPIVYVIVLAATTVTGRSASLAVLVGWGLILLAGKSRERMLNVGKRFPILLIVCVLFMFALKGIYTFAARNSLLTEEAVKKFENQTKDGSGVMQILMKGRVHFFIGLDACIQNPILGYGCFPVDKNGIREKFYNKWGDDSYYASRMRYFKKYGRMPNELIPAHSYIVGAWLNYGIFGLLMWGYVIVLAINHIRRNIAAVPQWYGYFALAVPTLLWDIMFSPFTERIIAPLTVCCLLLARAIGRAQRSPMLAQGQRFLSR